jgi:hypothetical protein
MRKQERELGMLLVNIRLDNTKEFLVLKSWATDLGVDLEFIEPHTQAQNGVAERLNRLLLEIARSLLIGMNIPKRYWPYAVKLANFIRNRTVFLKGEKKSPYEALYGRSYDLSKFRVPFCKVWFHVETQDKLDPRAKDGTFVAYTKSSNQYIILDKRGKEHKVTNPIFIEDTAGHLQRQEGERDLFADKAFQQLFYKASNKTNDKTSPAEIEVEYSEVSNPNTSTSIGPLHTVPVGGLGNLETESLQPIRIIRAIAILVLLKLR